MGWEIRSSTAQEIPDLVKADSAAFGHQPSDAQIESARALLEVDRALVAVDGGRVVGGAGALTLELTTPGPTPVPAAGVTYVGVLPTHRRQGILTALMGRLMDDARRRGEPVAALLASESAIYRRFGYGVAVLNSSVEIHRSYATLRRPVETSGRLRMVEREEMAEVLPPVFDRYRRQQPGEVSRSASYWAGRLEDPEARREGDGARFAVLWEEPGDDPAGYVTYRVRSNWDDGLPGHILAIEDLVALTPDVRAGLWQYCFGVDLVRVISAGNVPLDEPLWWMLNDPRRLRVTGVKDFLWVRMLDVEAALSARTYSSEQCLVIEVTDPSSTPAAGRYRLVGGGGEAAQCRRTHGPADVALDVADLASAYLGGVRFSTLARAGLVSELVPGALARADSLFASTPGPACCTSF